MHTHHNQLLKNNEQWAAHKLSLDPDYFNKTSIEQKPQFLWVGCSDSRVPANEITGTAPGEIFVHRNIANMVVHSDMNFNSVLNYAVKVLKVKHIIVCGHYGCGGVLAAMGDKDNGAVNNWLLHIKEVYAKHQMELDNIADFKKRANRLVELNVMEQVRNLGKSPVVQQAWQEHNLQIHGWVYSLSNGLLKDLQCTIDESGQVEPLFRFRFDSDMLLKKVK